MSLLKRSEFLFKAGYSVMMIDFQGHGKSQGQMITAGYLEKHDVTSAVAKAKSLEPGQPIAIIGISLGGAAALLASPLGVDALVLEGVYSTIRRAIQNRISKYLPFVYPIPTELLLLQFYLRFGIRASHLRPIDFVAKTKCPLFFISGTHDNKTTADEVKAMHQRAKSPRQLWLVKGARHVDLHRFTPKLYESKMVSFLAKYMNKSLKQDTTHPKK